MLQAERPPATLQLRGRGAATAGAGSTANASNAEHRTRRESVCVSCAALRARACYICLLHAYIECCVCILYAYMCCAARTARARNTCKCAHAHEERTSVCACIRVHAAPRWRRGTATQAGAGWSSTWLDRAAPKSPLAKNFSHETQLGRRKRLEADGAHARADGAAPHRDQRRPVLRSPVQLRHRLHDGAAGAHPGRRGVKRPPPLPGAPPRGGHPLRHSRLRVRACSHGCLYRWRPLRPHPSILAPWRATG